MMSTETATGPVATRTYVETSHLNHEMVAPNGRVLVHRYQHIVTGTHYVRDCASNDKLGDLVYAGPSETEARKAWFKLYRKYN